MISLKRLGKILKDQFCDHKAGFPENFIEVNYYPTKGKQLERLHVRIGPRDVDINSRGSVIGSGTSFVQRYKIVKRWTQ